MKTVKIVSCSLSRIYSTCSFLATCVPFSLLLFFLLGFSVHFDFYDPEFIFLFSMNYLKSLVILSIKKKKKNERTFLKKKIKIFVLNELSFKMLLNRNWNFQNHLFCFQKKVGRLLSFFCFVFCKR